MNILSHTKTDESMAKEKETVDENVPNNIDNSKQKVIKSTILTLSNSNLSIALTINNSFDNNNRKRN